MTWFVAAAVVATLIGAALVVVPLYRAPEGRAPLTALLTALLLPVIVAVLYAATSTYPWLAAPGSASGDPTAAVQVIDSSLIIDLKAVVKATPQDAEAWRRLGDAYLDEARFADAREAYHRVLELGEKDSDEMRLTFAEASILADRNTLSGEAGGIIDDVLVRSPANPKALWYGGMVALSRGDSRIARERWSKLLELSPPPQVREIIEEQLAQLGGNDLQSTPDQPPARTARVALRVSVKPELVARIQPGASLFVIAREPGGAGPPLAVVRRDAKLPLDVEISDTDSMVPGRSMADLPEVRLTARVANDGEAMPAPGDVYGETAWRPTAGGGARLEIVIDQVIQ